MADLAQLERALINADAAGDVEAAKALAGEISRLRAPTETARPTPVTIGQGGFKSALQEVLRNTDWGTRNIAGAGTALSDLIEGVKQLAGRGNKQAIEANNIIKQEAPIGAIAGNVAMMAPVAAAIPAVNTVKGAAALGGGMGLISPTEDENVVRGKALNTVLGAAAGAGGQAGANYVGGRIANRAQQLAQQQQTRAPIDATIQAARDAGYVIPPGQINPSFLNRQLESMGGKIATQQMASSRNQEVTDRLARAAAGLAENEPITPNTLGAVRQRLGGAYQDVGNVVGQDAVEQLKTLRADANALWNMQARNPHPETLRQARQASADAQSLEGLIDQALTSAQRPDLMEAFRNARRNIAINHSVENALVEGGGTVDARTIGRMAQRGDPLSGELETIGNFANNFPKVVQPDKAMGTPDAHNLKYIASLLMGGGGGAALGPAGIAAGALPFVSGPAARGAMFSDLMQNSLIPSYELGLPQRLAAALISRNQVPPAAAYGALEAFGQ